MLLNLQVQAKSSRDVQSARMLQLVRKRSCFSLSATTQGQVSKVFSNVRTVANVYVGFDEKEEELIFKPFSQIDGSSTRAHGGSGLGLVISRQLVELHGGTMGAESTKGKGS